MFNKYNNYKVNQVVEAKQEFDMAPPILVEGIIRKFENYADGEYCELLTHTGDIKVVKVSNIIQVLVDADAVENNEVIQSQPIIPAGGNTLDINNPGIGITPSLSFGEETPKEEPINYAEFVKPPEEVQTEAQEQYQDELNDRPEEFKEIQHIEVGDDYSDDQTIHLIEMLDDVVFVIKSRIDETIDFLNKTESPFADEAIKILNGEKVEHQEE